MMTESKKEKNVFVSSSLLQFFSIILIIFIAEVAVGVVALVYSSFVSLPLFIPSPSFTASSHPLPSMTPLSPPLHFPPFVS